jgi:hypothetical protein
MSYNSTLQLNNNNLQTILEMTNSLSEGRGKIKTVNGISPDKKGNVQVSGMNLEKVCLYYGWPIGIQGTWSVDAAVSIYKNYDIVIFGDTYQNPEHEAYAQTTEILTKLHQVAPKTRIVGYVPIGMSPSWKDSCLDMSVLKERVDMWVMLGVNGIFLDEFGYDYKVTRARQNEIVSYCHNKGLFVFANSWNPEWCFNNEPMEIGWIEDFEPNPEGLESVLNQNDYYLFENMFYSVNSTTHKMESVDVWRIDQLNRYYTEPRINGKTFYEHYGTKMCSLDGFLPNATEEELKKYQTVSLIAATILNIQAVAFGDYNWGSDGTFRTWGLPELNLASSGINGIVQEVKSYTDEFGEEHSFPYKWSTVINGKSCSFVCDIPRSDAILLEEGNRYVTIDGRAIEDAWLSIFNFQSDIANVKEDIREIANETIEHVNSVTANIDECLVELDAGLAKVEDGLTRIEAAIADVADTTSGFGFKEVQW